MLESRMVYRLSIPSTLHSPVDIGQVERGESGFENYQAINRNMINVDNILISNDILQKLIWINRFLAAMMLGGWASKVAYQSGPATRKTAHEHKCRNFPPRPEERTDP